MGFQNLSGSLLHQKTIHNQRHMYQAVTCQQVIHSMLLQNGMCSVELMNKRSFQKTVMKGMPHAVNTGCETTSRQHMFSNESYYMLCKVGI